MHFFVTTWLRHSSLSRCNIGLLLFFWGASCLITLQDMAQRKIQGHWLCADRLGTYGEHITWDGVLRLGTTPWHGKSHIAMNYTRCYKQLAFPLRSDLAVAEPTSAPSQSRLCSLAVKMIRHGMILLKSRLRRLSDIMIVIILVHVQ